MFSRLGRVRSSAKVGISNHRRASTSAYRPSPVRTAAYASVFVLSSTAFLVYYFDSRAAIHRYVFTPILRALTDAETSHTVALRVLESGLAPKETEQSRKGDELLQCELWGIPLANPIGLAAGFDKNGEAIDALFDLGFSWVEVGSVTPKPQPGNPKPRVHRLTEDQAIINSYGFPSQGAATVSYRLQRRIHDYLAKHGSEPPRSSLDPSRILAINLGKNKSSPPDSIADFVWGVENFGHLADVLVVNVSSPNTAGLRDLQTRGLLTELVRGITAARSALPSHIQNRPKLVLKIAPDLTEDQVKAIAEVLVDSWGTNGDGIDGVIVSNTTISRPSSLTDPNRGATGGLSGPPLKPITLYVLRTLRKHLDTFSSTPSKLPTSISSLPYIPIIAAGGISSGDDALAYLDAGADFVQLYTSLTYDGVGAVSRIKESLREQLRGRLGWADVVKARKQEKEAAIARAVSEQLKLEAQTDPDSTLDVKALTREAEELLERLDSLAKNI